MLRFSAFTVCLVLAASGCKKENKTAPAVASGSAPAAGSDMTPPKVEPDAAVAAAPPAEAKWEKFTSKDGGFTIDFPSAPQESEQGGMKIVGSQFGKTAADDREAMCGVAFMNLGDAAKGDPKKMLEGATARHKQDAKVMEDKDVKLGKYPGKSLVVQNDKHRKWIRVYIVDTNIYVLNCGGPSDRGDADGPTATKILDSFALAK